MAKSNDKEVKNNMKGLLNISTGISVIMGLLAIGYFIYGIVCVAEYENGIAFLIYSIISPTIYILIAVVCHIFIKWMVCVLGLLVDIKNK